MAKREKPNPVKKATGSSPAVLKGWKQIANFLGQPVTVAQRWAGEGMPVAKQGRYVETSPDQAKPMVGSRVRNNAGSAHRD
jgi:hypothetical protein